MPSVDVDLVIRSPLDDVWIAINDIEAYPHFMENVLSVELIDSSEAHLRVSAWSVLLKGSVLQWSEREEVDAANHRITFHQLDGDLDLFSGEWVLQQVDDELVRARLTVEFEIGIPLLAEMLNPVASRALRDNSEQMLRAIEARVAIAAAADPVQQREGA